MLFKAVTEVKLTVPFLYEVFKNCIIELCFDVISCHCFGVYEVKITKVYNCVSTFPPVVS